MKDRMKENRYAQHKMEIREISEREGVDIGVACAMLRNEKQWTFPETGGIDEELRDFVGYCNDLPAAERRAYFGYCDGQPAESAEA